MMTAQSGSQYAPSPARGGESRPAGVAGELAAGGDSCQTRPMSAVPPPPPARHRRQARRRLFREQMLVALILLLLLAATVVLLCFEWLAASPASLNAPPLLHLLGGST